jgi:hypothetical protein
MCKNLFWTHWIWFNKGQYDVHLTSMSLTFFIFSILSLSCQKNWQLIYSSRKRSFYSLFEIIFFISVNLLLNRYSNIVQFYFHVNSLFPIQKTNILLNKQSRIVSKLIIRKLFLRLYNHFRVIWVDLRLTLSVRHMENHASTLFFSKNREAKNNY